VASGRTFERTIMEYALAKQLKDAGFHAQVYKGSPAAEERHHAIIPTLEELIEACGEDFIQLELAEIELGKWCAQGGWDEQDVKDVGHCRTPKHDAFGATPTEAVARLWLALHANGDASA
jgi:hypothetical protein